MVQKTKFKRLSKGQRTHVRRLKQAARQEGTIYRSPIIHRAPVKIPKE
jgi:hypothetical protein